MVENYIISRLCTVVAISSVLLMAMLGPIIFVNDLFDQYNK